ncbi:hypothetical protein ACFY2M_19380 [Streptomyces sp. NPDC001276]|uniref:hypothetical protein n=1 Tax=Streptomyces sp. NPDC001276 TaxID=3364555 RepID=UPI0036B15D3A
MSAEHSKVKDPLPTRPPRPHPQGFVLYLDDDGHEELRAKVRAANKRSESRPK